MTESEGRRKMDQCLCKVAQRFHIFESPTDEELERFIEEINAVEDSITLVSISSAMNLFQGGVKEVDDEDHQAPDG